MRIGNLDPVAPLPLKRGDKLRFDKKSKWWHVRTHSSRFTVLVQQAPFEPKGTPQYTIIDWEHGVRGACNLLGGGWGDGTDNQTEWDELQAALEYDRHDDPAYIAYKVAGSVGGYVPSMNGVEVSHRNRVPLVITDEMLIA